MTILQFQLRVTKTYGMRASEYYVAPDPIIALISINGITRKLHHSPPFQRNM